MHSILVKFYLLVAGLPVHADNDIVSSVNSVLNDIMTKTKSIATPVAVICGVFCGIKLLIASDPQSVKSAKSWLITIVIGLLVIYLAGPLVNTVVNILNTN